MHYRNSNLAQAFSAIKIFVTQNPEDAVEINSSKGTEKRAKITNSKNL